MPLSWNEIRHRAITFSRDHKDATSEQGERQTFWNEFFEVFGKKRRHLATFEEPVKKLSGNWGYIDLFWPGKCIVEHKSKGQDLGKAHAQGMDYVRGLIDSGREKECPRWLIVSDFQRIAIHDLEPEQDPNLPLFTRLPPSHEFALKDLPKNIRHFAFIAGYKSHKLNPEDPANFQATELMAKLHDALYDGGFRGHQLCQFLVRLLFCFFADDTGIFPPDQLKLFLRDRTAEDGSDLGPKLAHLFHVLDTPDGSKGTENKRGLNLDEDLAQFPYINGDLFRERLDFTDFTRAMRDALLECCDFTWEKISPAVFGSLFQTVFDHQDDRKRRQLGAHYTSEKNILKVIRSLFLDADRAEFEAAKKDKSGRGPARLRALQEKLATYRIMDPACGCGNFLVITYRELRQLELEILIHLQETQQLLGQQEFGEQEIYNLSRINVDQMYGIEIEEFPARIAEVALWLADHQANVLLSEAFGQFFTRIPLRKSPTIRIGNALRTDWKDVLSPDQCSFVLGNPPFIGKRWMSKEQKEDMARIWNKVKGAGVLDFVTCWHRLAAEYIQGTQCTVAFVSTNSISQGEQVGVLWNHLHGKYGLKIHFAHRPFTWESEARGKAHVHCVIIGFGTTDIPNKRLFDYVQDTDEVAVIPATNISPYLFEGNDVVVTSSSRPLSAPFEITFGSMANDGGFLLMTTKEKNELLAMEPLAGSLIRPFRGAEEFIKGTERWCLWLTDVSPSNLRGLPSVMKRIEGVRNVRLSSSRKATRDLSKMPSLFGEIRQPDSRYLVVPRVSSENRQYIPWDFLEADTIAGDRLAFIVGAGLYELGILHSAMHMQWVKTVCGRLESRFNYSNGIVYNNFPWPMELKEGQRGKVEQAAQAVLDARAKHATSTLADLYDPLTMPPDLAKAHAVLDAAVDRCYRPAAFPNDRARVEHLFALYEAITAPLAPAAKQKRGGRKA
jgi:hypothetical protein